jgi:hypothetical protein
MIRINRPPAAPAESTAAYFTSFIATGSHWMARFSK